MGFAFEHAFEIDQVFLGFFFIIFILLFFLLHEAEHLVFRVLLEVFLEVHDGFLLIQRTHTSSFSPIETPKMRKVAYLPSFRFTEEIVDVRQALESQFFAFLAGREAGARVEVQHEEFVLRISMVRFGSLLFLTPVREHHFSLETAVLAADLQFLGSNLNNLHAAQGFSCEPTRSSSAVPKPQASWQRLKWWFWWVFGYNIEQLCGGWRFGVFRKAAGSSMNKMSFSL